MKIRFYFKEKDDDRILEGEAWYGTDTKIEQIEAWYGIKVLGVK